MPILRLAGAADSVAAWIAADTGSSAGPRDLCEKVLAGEAAVIPWQA